MVQVPLLISRRTDSGSGSPRDPNIEARHDSLGAPRASVILSRWEDRLSDVFSALPFGFKEEIANALTEKLRSPLLGKHGKDSLDKLYRKSTRTATD